LVAAHSFAGSATWKLNPTSNDWNTAANWTPAIVPNGPNDTATFDVSNTNALSISKSSEVNGIVFNPGARTFTITLPSVRQNFSGLTFSGAGITNNSGQAQTFMATTQRFSGFGSGIFFLNSATAGTLTNFVVEGGAANDFPGALIYFQDSSSAGNAVFTITGAKVSGAEGGDVSFSDNSTAANGTFVCNGTFAGVTVFPPASAGDATFVANDGGHVTIYSSIGDATITINGNSNGSFLDGTVIGHALFTTNGGTTTGAPGGYTGFGYTGGFDLGNSTIVANGGVNGGKGGEVHFFDASNAGTARVEIFGNGSCDISGHAAPGTSLGSIEGDGLIFLGANNLTTGASNLSTTFSGVIQDGGANGGNGGSLTKIGSGRLTLSGANSYAGGATIQAGTLLAKNPTGSATGFGMVQVSGGLLGGKGIISGPTTIGTGSGVGAFLQPGKGASTPITLTIQNTLTFKSDGTYTWKLNTKKAKADQVIANGVTIEPGAQFDSNTVGNKKLAAGKVFTAISNTSATPINGTFANLADGSTVTVGVNKLQVSYSGGDGNDLTLTATP
jgi:autotransporter-associated beta strand protein